MVGAGNAWRLSHMTSSAYAGNSGASSGTVRVMCLTSSGCTISLSAPCAVAGASILVEVRVRVGVGVGVGMRVRLSVSSRTATRKPDRELAHASIVRYACSKPRHAMRTVHCHASIRCARNACSGRPRPWLGQG